jgi:hypothetical protein
MKTAWILAVIATGLVAAGGCALIDRMDGVHDAKTLQRVGEPAEAVVLDIWDTGITVNEDPVVGLRVEVRPADRPAYTAEIKKSLISRVHVPQFQPGSHVPVRIDRSNPMRVALDAYTYR